MESIWKRLFSCSDKSISIEAGTLKNFCRQQEVFERTQRIGKHHVWLYPITIDDFALGHGWDLPKDLFVDAWRKAGSKLRVHTINSLLDLKSPRNIEATPLSEGNQFEVIRFIAHSCD